MGAVRPEGAAESARAEIVSAIDARIQAARVAECDKKDESARKVASAEQRVVENSELSYLCVPAFPNTLWKKKHKKKDRRDEFRMAHVILRDARGPLAH